MMPAAFSKRKAVIVVLLISTVVAMAITIKGITIVYNTNKAIRDAAYTTEEILRNPDTEHTENTKEGADGNALSGEDRAGYAVLTIFSPKENKIAVYDGLTNENLSLGAARASESAAPGESGNCIVYGHRDSAFRCLKDIKTGDMVEVMTGEKKCIYEVKKTQICTPEAYEIWQPYSSPYLTLVTCYPFVYSGPMQERYIVICRLVGENPI